MSIQSKQTSSVKIFIILLAVFLLFGICKLAAAVENVKFIQELSGLTEPIDIAVTPKGDRYVLERQMSKVNVYGADGKMLFTIGSRGSSQGQMLNPIAIAITNGGELLVADTGNSRVLVFGVDGRFHYQLGNAGVKAGQFDKPVGIAVDQAGYIFVADEGRKTISKYSPNGVFLQMWKLDNKPKEIVFDLQHNLYVLMPDEGYILKYSPDMKPVAQITYVAGNANYIEETTSMAVDHRGDIYIIEKLDNNIKKIDQAGNMMFSFGSKGAGRGQFNDPLGIEADWAGNIYVADSKNKRVQIMSVTGSEKPALKTVLRDGPLVDYDSSIAAEQAISDLQYIGGKGLYALGDISGHVLWKAETSMTLNTFGSQDTVLRYPKGIHITDKGEMLVAESGANRLHFLKSDASSQYSFGIKGEKTSEFNELQDVVIGPNGLIYVADTFNNRIQIFSRDGIYLNSFGGKTSGRDDSPAKGTFLNPKSLVFDSKGQLHVLDTKNRRVQVFTMDGEFIRDLGPKGDIYAGLVDPVDIDVDENDILYIADRGDHMVKIYGHNGELITQFGSNGFGPSYFPMLSAVSAHAGKIYVSDYKVGQVKVYNFGDQVALAAQKRAVTAKEESRKMAVKAEEPKPEKKIMKEAAVEKPVPAETPVPEKTAEVIQPAEPVAIPAPLQLAKKHVISDDITFKAYVQNDRLFVNTYAMTLNDQIKLDLDMYNIARDALLNSTKDKLSEKFGIAAESITDSMNIEQEEIMENGEFKLTISVPKDILAAENRSSKLTKGN